MGGVWKLSLASKPAGGNYTITVACIDCHLPPTVITNVTFGDVFFCSGQSNMWLPVHYTFSRNKTYDALKRGKYQNIRLYTYPKVETNDTVFISDQVAPWLNADNNTVDGFSATCWYFAQYLTDKIGQDVPIGLIHSAIGGSRLEQWSSREAVAKCKDLDQDQGNHGVLFYGMTTPFVNMTVKMVMWYQGENNVKECCD